MDPSRRASRTVALTILAIATSAACVFLGVWQGQRAQDIIDAERAALSAPIPVRQAMSADDYPADSVGRPVTAQGSFANSEQLLVAQREWQGSDGEWVLAPFVVDGQTLVVLRGWVDSPASAALVLPVDAVTLTGILQPFEDFYSEQPRRDDGQLVAISRPAIEAAWGATVLPLVLVQTGQQPESQPAPQLVLPTVQTSNVPFPLQNAAYTLQWFVFAAFVWVMWWMWTRRDARSDADATEADSLDS